MEEGHEFALAAVQQGGKALQHASTCMQGSLEIVQAAVQQNRLASFSTSSVLKQPCGVLRVAIRKNAKVLRLTESSVRLWNNQQLRNYRFLSRQ